MASPVDFPESNFSFTPPPDLENCQTLKVWRGKDDKDIPTVISVWELTEEELAEIAKTKKVFLGIISPGSIPPVYITGISPFLKPEPPQPPEE